MALADIVLEGLTLILVIALGAVLIGGLSYLATTTASANNARLITAGTYVYLPGPTYINGTLYVPMYNIGRYAVQVRYIFIRGPGGVSEYPVNISLGPGQYYVYELDIDYAPSAVTIVVSPINDPGLTLEFSANVTTPGPITPAGTSLSAQGCPVLASVSDPYNAGWQVTWTMAGSTYSVSKSTSYQWCILPPYYPITINFQSTITSNPSGYICQISPQSTQVNYNGTPTTVPFTVTCQQQQQPPPPPPPPPGGSGSVTMTLVIDDGPGVSWTAKVDQYISGAYWIVWEQSGSSSGTYSVNLAEGYQYAISVSVPSGCTASGSPVALGSLFTASSPFTETVTITCQSTTPPPPTTYGCFLTVKGQTNPSGIATVQVYPTSTFVPSGQTQTITAYAPLQVGGNPWYEFDSWSGSVTSGPGSLSEHATGITGGDAYSTWIYTCPSGLTSNVTATVTITANYVYDYVDLVGPTVVSSSPVEYTLKWNVAPGSAYQIQWSVTHGSTTFTVSATLYYTEYGKSLSGSSSLQATVYCSVGQPLITDASIIGPTTYVTSGSSGTNSVYVEVTWQCFKGIAPT
jgi:hypothetical protein